MVSRHHGETREFRELSFAEQAESITSTLTQIEAAIEYHVEHSPRRLETIEAYLDQVDRLRHRLWDVRGRLGIGATSPLPIAGGEAGPRIRVGSPRLAEPERAADFIMDVAEVSPDAVVR